jgi:succinate-semialdehyde dehydrogenase/glutarate-semialdehyde dehydrogenase
MVTHEPAGVALLVTPWNFPAAMATRKIAPALAAGCTVVLKPAVDTPLTALALADLLARAGVPSGVVNVVLPDPPGAAVSAMLRHPKVRVLSFTGSTAVGRQLLAEAANSVIHCSMELGGNAPFVVLDDADLDRAVEGLMVAKLRNGGSACTAANRIYVHESIADEFVSRFDDQMAAIRVGDGSDPATQVGAMINRAALDKVASLVSSTCAAGARASTGGRPVAGRGYFFEPTVLVDVPRDAVIMQEEIFGPVAPVVRFDDLEEAITLANGTDAGLVAYAYTRDLSRGLELSRRLQAGMVGINKAVVSDPAAPFGGINQSGLGREGAQQGILEFLETKYTAFPYS